MSHSALTERTPRRELRQLLDLLFQPVDFLAKYLRLGIIAYCQPVFEPLETRLFALFVDLGLRTYSLSKTS